MVSVGDCCMWDECGKLTWRYDWPIDLNRNSSRERRSFEDYAIEGKGEMMLDIYVLNNLRLDIHLVRSMLGLPEMYNVDVHPTQNWPVSCQLWTTLVQRGIINSLLMRYKLECANAAYHARNRSVGAAFHRVIVRGKIRLYKNDRSGVPSCYTRKGRPSYQ